MFLNFGIFSALTLLRKFLHKEGCSKGSKCTFCVERQNQSLFNPIRPGLFWSSWTSGGASKAPHLHKSESIDAIDINLEVRYSIIS